MRQLLMVMACLPMVMWSCETDDVTPDYRDAFVGTYDGRRVSTTWMMGQPTQTTFDGPDTYTVEAVADSFIRINQMDSIPVGPDGAFEQFSGGSNYFSVNFSATDSIHVTSSSGGLGGGSTTNFRGKKRG